MKEIIQSQLNEKKQNLAIFIQEKQNLLQQLNEISIQIERYNGSVATLEGLLLEIKENKEV